MVEEVIKYRVEVDQSDLAAQLADIKNQIDVAMGSISFTAPPVIENSRPFGDIFQRTSQFFSNTGDFITERFSVPVGSAITGGVESLQHGYQRFGAGLQSAGFVSPPQFLNQYPLEDVATWGFVPKERGFVGSALRSWGLGYNYDMPISRGEFRDVYSRMAGRKGADFMTSALSTGLFLTGHPLAALSVEAIWAGTKFLGFEHDAVRSLGAFIEASSERNVGALSESEARDVARHIRGMGDDPLTRIKIGGPNKVDNLIAESIAAGMFLDTANAEEFKTRATEIVENFRTIQHAMKTFSKEAIEIMKEISMSGITSSPAEIATLAQNVSIFGKMMGRRETSMLSFSMQAAEMVRGTGRSMLDTFQESGLILKQIDAGLKTGTFDADFVKQAGGGEAIALSLQDVAFNFANTLPGRVYTAASMGGYRTSSLDPNALFHAISTGIPYTGSADDLVGRLVELEKKSLGDGINEHLYNMMSYIVTNMRSAGVEVTPEKLGYVVRRQTGMSHMDSESLVNYWLTDPSERNRAMARLEIERDIKSRGEVPSGLEFLWGKVWGAISGGVRSVSMAVGRGAESYMDAIEYGLKDVGIISDFSGSTTKRIRSLQEEAMFGEDVSSDYSLEDDPLPTRYLFPELFSRRGNFFHSLVHALFGMGVPYEIGSNIDLDTARGIVTGKITELGGVDLTAYKSRYRAIRKTEDKFKNLFGDIPEGPTGEYELRHEREVREYKRRARWSNFTNIIPLPYGGAPGVFRKQLEETAIEELKRKYAGPTRKVWEEAGYQEIQDRVEAGDISQEEANILSEDVEIVRSVGQQKISGASVTTENLKTAVKNIEYGATWKEAFPDSAGQVMSKTPADKVDTSKITNAEVKGDIRSAANSLKIIERVLTRIFSGEQISRLWGIGNIGGWR